MVIPVILLVAFNVWTSMAATVNVPDNGADNWEIGKTLHTLIDRRYDFPSPFTPESRDAFQEAFKAVKAEDPITLGEFTFTVDFVSSMEEKTSLLDLTTSLEMSYMAYSADAHMSFMKENAMSEYDISAIVRASSDGRKWQVTSADIDRLELIDISDDIVTLADFTEAYGDYLIIGWIYGGEIMYEARYTAKSEESKDKIEAELCGSYGNSGFGGSASGCIENESTSEHRADSFDFDDKESIRPNSIKNDPAIEDLIKALSSISQGQSGEDGNEYEQLRLSAKEVLSGDLDPVQAVVVSLSSVGAVHAKFKGNDGETVTAAFMKFLNEMYMKVEGLTIQLDMVKKQWEKSETDGHPMPSDTIKEWEESLLLLNYELLSLDKEELLINKCADYQAILGARSWVEDVLTATSFVEFKLSDLEDQFNKAIKTPYEDMLEWATKPLEWRGEEPDSALERCEGDCDDDSDCVDHLECWQRTSKGMPVPPGCSGQPIMYHDYCWDLKFQKTLNYTGLHQTDLRQCEGDCDEDSDCRGGLKCYHRGSNVRGSPPGCSGDTHGFGIDYCWGGEEGIVSARSPGVMMEDPIDADYGPIVEDPSNESPTVYVIGYYDLVTVLLASLVVLCAVNLCVTVRQRQQHVGIKHRTLW